MILLMFKSRKTLQGLIFLSTLGNSLDYLNNRADRLTGSNELDLWELRVRIH